jgi:hypothetical protein
LSDFVLEETEPVEPEEWAVFLAPGERMYWQGRPGRGIRLRPSDWVALPIGLALLALAVAFTIGVGRAGAEPLFALTGLPFVLAGLHLSLGRLVWDAHGRAHSRYALTDRRVLIARARAGRSFLEFPVTPALAAEYREGAEPSILLDPDQGTERERGPARLAGLLDIGNPNEVGLEFLRDGHRVYLILRALQREARLVAAGEGAA